MFSTMGYAIIFLGSKSGGSSNLACRWMPVCRGIVRNWVTGQATEEDVFLRSE